MLETILAIILVFGTLQFWIPVAIIWSFIKLITSLSIFVAWDAFKSVPAWIWDFAHNIL